MTPGSPANGPSRGSGAHTQNKSTDKSEDKAASQSLNIRVTTAQRAIKRQLSYEDSPSASTSSEDTPVGKVRLSAPPTEPQSSPEASHWPGSPYGSEPAYQPRPAPPQITISSSSTVYSTTSTAQTTTTTFTSPAPPIRQHTGNTLTGAMLGMPVVHTPSPAMDWMSPDWNPGPEELMQSIEAQDLSVLIENESKMICAAARQPEPDALALLNTLGLAFRPVDLSSPDKRGWNPGHCPFRTAIRHQRIDNLVWLCQNDVKPDAELIRQIPTLPEEFQLVFLDYCYVPDEDEDETAPAGHPNATTTRSSVTSISSTATTSTTSISTTTTTTTTTASRRPGSILDDEKYRAQESPVGNDFDDEVVSVREALRNPTGFLPPSPEARPGKLMLPQLSQSDLVEMILNQPDELLRPLESFYIRMAAEQDSSLALDMLLERGVAFQPLDLRTGRGWQAQHCPFQAAIDQGRMENLDWLLQRGIQPGPVLLASLPALEAKVIAVFAQYDYL